jgi:hypothetical protein
MAMRAVEEPRVELLFQLPDLKGHRGLRHEQGLGRLGERQMLRDRVKYLETPIRHMSRAVISEGAFKHKAGRG